MKTSKNTNSISGTQRFLLVLSVLIALSFNTFAEFSISGAVFSPASPATIATNSRVNLTFKYQQTTTTGVRIYAQPLYNGATIPGTGTSGSPLYTAVSGNATAFFQISTPSTVNQVRFRIYASDNTTLLYETSVVVNYKIVNYNLSNFSFSPTSPATIPPGSRVDISFKYIQTSATGVRIYAQPMYNGLIIPGTSTSASPLYTAGTGTATSFFAIPSEALVNQVRFRIYASDNVTLLYETFVNVTYTVRVAWREADEASAPSITSAFEVGPVPAIDFFTITNNSNSEYNYQLIDATGAVVNEGKTGDTENQINTQNSAPGMYILKLTQGADVTEKKIIIQ